MAGRLLQSFLDSWFYYAVPIACVMVWRIISTRRIKCIEDDTERYAKKKRKIANDSRKAFIIVTVLTVFCRVFFDGEAELFDRFALLIWFFVDMIRLIGGLIGGD